MDERDAPPVRYRIDAGRSRFVVQAFADGLLAMFGHDPVLAVTGFGGDARCIPATLGAASLLFLVKADSLLVAGDMSEKDRREIERAVREELLETARYPEIAFLSASITAKRQSEGQYQVEIIGDLSLHGVTRRCPINARVTAQGDELRAQGEFKLRQSDYHIKPTSVAGGTLRVKDELKLSFDIRAVAAAG